MLRRLLGAFGRRIGRAAGGESRSPPSQESAARDQAVQDSIQAQVEASRAELERASARLKLYLERAPLACVVWDMTGVVREWNPAAEQIFGYTAAEAIGANARDLIATPSGLAVVNEVRSRIRAGDRYPDGVTTENRRKDGSILLCQWHIAIVRDSGGEESVLAFGSDVTASLRAREEREALESSLRQAQKLQALGTLAAGIAHDFNNILLAISGNAKLAAQDLPADHAAQISIGEISRASARAASIVNQVLAFGRGEESTHGPVDLGSVVKEAINLTRAMAPMSVATRVRIAAGQSIVRGDASQLHQVVVNLATNALHAMQESGGALDVEVAEVELDESRAAALHVPPGRYQRLRISDTGVGMPQELLERIFEPFFTTKPQGRGVGLGLSVVHGIVQAHRGAITATSRPGEGSTFEVHLAALDAAPGEDQQQTAATPVHPGSGQRILFVDDEESLVYLMVRVLERFGYRVVGFSDAHAALEAFLAQPEQYDVVVTDLSMPGMTGAEFARQVLAARPDAPVIMTSGYVRPEDRQAAMAVGVRELLLKPNTVEDLAQALHRTLNAARAAAAQPPLG